MNGIVKIPIAMATESRAAGELLASGLVEGDHLVISQRTYARICRRHRPFMLGDWMARMLAAVGIRQQQGCGCEARKRRLNKLGAKAKAIFDKLS